MQGPRACGAWPCFGFALSLLCVQLCLASSVSDSAPAFLWGPGPFLAGASGQKGSRVSYQAHTASFLLDDVVLSLLSTGAVSEAAADVLDVAAVAASMPEVVILLLGSQLHSKDLPKTSLRESLAPLTAALKAAESALSLPQILHEEQETLTSAVLRKLAGRLPSTVHRLGSCADSFEPVTASSVETLLQSVSTERPQVLLVCPEAVAGLAAEMATLEVLQSAVQESGKSYIFLYATDPRVQGGRRGGRSLLAGAQAPAPSPPGPMVCDDKCRTQVKQLEAGLLVLTILAALLMGTWCMHNLDTPTRFETPKDHTS